MDAPHQLQGRGRAIITASNAMEYAYEGDELTGEGQPSVFTEAVVEGLRTGKADLDMDHLISIDDLYHYVYDRVRERTPNQTPSIKSDLEGVLYLARSSYRAPVVPAKLDPELVARTEDRYAGIREGAVQELAEPAELDRPVGRAGGAGDPDADDGRRQPAGGGARADRARGGRRRARRRRLPTRRCADGAACRAPSRGVGGHLHRCTSARLAQADRDRRRVGRDRGARDRRDRRAERWRPGGSSIESSATTTARECQRQDPGRKSHQEPLVRAGPDDGTRFSGAERRRLSREQAADAPDGHQIVRVMRHADKGDFGDRRRPDTVQESVAGTPYTAAAWVKATASTDGHGRLPDGPRAQRSTASDRAGSGGTACRSAATRQLRGAYTARGSGDRIDVYLYYPRHNGSSGDTFLADAISLTPGDRGSTPGPKCCECPEYPQGVSVPDLELLWWEGCPSTERALAELREALADAGLGDAEIRTREIDSDGDAEQAGFEARRRS